jgi:uncharacterized protein (TIGR02678 family)
LADETGDMTDVAMPAEGTDAHVTLLVADFLARQSGVLIGDDDVAAFVRKARDRYGRYWRKSAREPGSERELAAIALDRLAKLRLITRDGDTIRSRPALARFALGQPEMRVPTPRATPNLL